jgi:hypothetical protein
MNRSTRPPPTSQYTGSSYQGVATGATVDAEAVLPSADRMEESRVAVLLALAWAACVASAAVVVDVPELGCKTIPWAAAAPPSAAD